MIVLSIITKNSTERLGMKLFADVLISSLQVLYNPIILVDDSISDKTAEIVGMFTHEHGKEDIIERSRSYGYPIITRATARQTAINIF